MIQRWLTQVGVATSHPLALAAVAAFVAVWLMFDHSFGEPRHAVHAKLDELLRAESKARNELTALDDKEPEEIIEHRDEERASQ